MSGLEAAGLILGAFPLVLSAIEHGHSIAKAKRRYRHIQKEYKDCRHDVEYHQLWYGRNLKSLLQSIATEADVEVDGLLADPAAEAWKSNTLQSLLQSRLQDTYGLYMNIMQRMNEALDGLAKELAMDDAALQARLIGKQQTVQQATASDSDSSPAAGWSVAAKSRFDYASFRIKFSLGEAIRRDYFEQLQECNTRLEKVLNFGRPELLAQITNATDSLDSPGGRFPRSNQTPALQAVFKTTRKKSELLYKAMQRAWQCPCEKHHFANLRLEHRTTQRSMGFEVILTYAMASNKTARWSWKELHCAPMVATTLKCPCSKIAAKTPVVLPHTSMPTPLAISRTKLSAQSSSRGQRKRVRIKDPVLESLAMASLHTALPAIETASAAPTIRLCQRLGEEISMSGSSHDDDSSQTNSNNLVGNHDESTRQRCFGLISHSDETYHLHTLDKREQASKVTTLDDVLGGAIEEDLNRRQRYLLALLLASSIAQLHCTPWLRAEGISKEDVLFFPGCHAGHPYEEPFIRQDFLPRQTAQEGGEGHESSFSRLGIVLLELCFGKRLEDHPWRKRYPDEAGEVKQMFDILAATKWAQAVGDEGGPDYASAVQWCLTGAKLGDSWRGEMIRHVVAPLERCQAHFMATQVR